MIFFCFVFGCDLFRRLDGALKNLQSLFLGEGPFSGSF